MHVHYHGQCIRTVVFPWKRADKYNSKNQLCSSRLAEVELEALVLSAHAKSSKDDSSSVEFSWNPPSHILPQYITDYTLRCYDKAKGAAYDVTKTLNSSQTSVTLKDLPADRSYSAYVMFSTAFGKGLQSEVVDFDTSGEKVRFWFSLIPSQAPSAARPPAGSFSNCCIQLETSTQYVRAWYTYAQIRCVGLPLCESGYSIWNKKIEGRNKLKTYLYIKVPCFHYTHSTLNAILGDGQNYDRTTQIFPLAPYLWVWSKICNTRKHDNQYLLWTAKTNYHSTVRERPFCF